VVTGLLAGTIPAIIAIAPHIASGSTSLPWMSIGLTLAGVLGTGMLAGVVALGPALHSPVLPALRAE
jgi:hypothetical protein